MTANTILTTANGGGIDLMNPRAADIDFAVIAEHLAKEKRYNGATRGVEYSVAQHVVIGTDAILSDTSNAELAAYFILHDAPEAFLKDDTTPKKRAVAAIAQERFGVLSTAIMDSFDLLTERFDAAIHEAAGIAWPMPDAMKAGVKAYDLAMFVTEWRDLMPNVMHPSWDEYRDIAPLPHTIEPWGWRVAQRELTHRFQALLPSLQKARAS